MPPVIIAAVAVYAGAITLTTFVLVAVTYAYSSYQASRARKKARDAYNASLQDRLQMVATVDGYRSRLYGRARNVDGILFKATRGTNSEYFTLVIAIAGHEVDAIEDVYFGDTRVDLDANGYVLTAPWSGIPVGTPGRVTQAPDVEMTITAGSGSVTLPNDPIAGSIVVTYFTASQEQGIASPTIAGRVVSVSGLSNAVRATVFYQYMAAASASSSKARVRKYLGSPTQDLSAVLQPLFPSLIQAGVHRFAGIACLVVDLLYDQDAYPNGVPNITAVARGAKIIDSRTGVAAWSENPSLIARDWSLYSQGGGCETADLREDSFIAMANGCDVTHSFVSVNAAGTSVTTARPMFSCGIVCKPDADPSATLSNIVEAMAGAWAWTGGQLRVRAGIYTAPVATLTESWCSGAGDIDIVAGVARADLVNVYTPTIADIAQAFVPVPIPRIAATAYIEADGGELPLDVTLEGVTDVDHAQHVCGIMLRDQRQGMTASIPCNLRAFPLEVFDNIALNLPTFGWTGKEMLVMGWEFSQTGGVVLSLKETDASIYDPDAQFTRSDPAPNTSLPNPFKVPTLSIASVASGTAELLKQADGTIVSRIRVTWASIADEAVRNGGGVEVLFGTAGTPVGQFQTLAAQGTDTQAFITNVQDGAVYVIMLRARNKLVRGNWSSPKSVLVLGKLEPPAAVQGLALSVVPGALKGTRTPSTELDYDRTVYRYGASFAAGTPVPGTSDGNGFVWPWPALGTYTIWAADVDTTGNIGTPVSASITVNSAILIGAGQSTPGGGAALNANPACDDVSAWDLDSGVTGATTTSAGAVGTRFWHATSGTDKKGWTHETIPLNPARIYNLSANLGAGVGNNRNTYLVVRMFNADGTELTNSDTGWGGAYAGYVFGAVMTSDNTWRRYGADFGAGTGRAIPAVAAYCKVGFWLQYSGSGSSAVEQAVQDLRLVDVTDARAASTAAAAAAQAASDAQADADAANLLLADISADNKLTASEKQSLRKQWDALINEKAGINAQAAVFSITTENTAYNSAVQTLGTYLNNGAAYTLSTSTPPSWISDANLSVTTTIAGTTLRTNWLNATTARQALLNAISAKAKALADGAQLTANNAASAASDAQADADTANALLADISADNKLTPVEKQSLRKEWDAEVNAKAGINAQAAAFGITTENTNYNNSMQALGNYLNGGTTWTFSTSAAPLWISDAQLGTTTSVAGATLRANWAAFLSIKQILLNKIAAVASTLATWDGTSGSNKPLDNAGKIIDLGAGTTTFGQRQRNDAPNEYPIGLTMQFKQMTSIGLASTGNGYCTLETNKGYADNTGVNVVQYAYDSLGVAWKRYGQPAATSWAGAWTQDLDRNLYTGDLAATQNQVFFQDTDPVTSPGGVTNGAIWISSTKAWQRVSGAWKPYVGPNSIDTPQLVDESATKVDVITSPSVSVSGAPVQVCLTTLPGPGVYELTFTAQASVTAFTSAGQLWTQFVFPLGLGSNPAYGNVYPKFQITVLGQVVVIQQAITFVWTDATTAAVSFSLSLGSGSWTAYVDTPTLRVTEIRK